MKVRALVPPIAAAVVLILSVVAFAADPRTVGITLTRIQQGFNTPVAMAFTPDGRVLVDEQGGVLKYVTPDGATVGTVMNISARISSSGERGLLGVAVHPKFASNHYIYLFFTEPSTGTIRVSRFTMSGNTASASSELIIIRIAHPTYSNHNGGQLQFGKDGFLYIGVGDGGGSGGPGGNAQNLGSLLGKILRIDVDHWCGSTHYCSPSTNPFAHTAGAHHEIWQWGLRNPWRFSFDREAGHLFIGDVGQGAREEID
ncbi:MAG: sorbosone dehydrogenase family protein, partial [Actinomycetota bacterium]